MVWHRGCSHAVGKHHRTLIAPSTETRQYLVVWQSGASRNFEQGGWSESVGGRRSILTTLCTVNSTVQKSTVQNSTLQYNQLSRARSGKPFHLTQTGELRRQPDKHAACTEMCQTQQLAASLEATIQASYAPAHVNDSQSQSAMLDAIRTSPLAAGGWQPTYSASCETPSSPHFPKLLQDNRLPAVPAPGVSPPRAAQSNPIGTQSETQGCRACHDCTATDTGFSQCSARF